MLGAGTYGCVFQVAVDSTSRKRHSASRGSGVAARSDRRVAIKIIPGSVVDERVYVETSMPNLRGLLCPERAWATPSSLMVQFPLGVCDAEAFATMCGARLPLGVAACVLLQVAQSVRRIHGRHIMHRDLTSSNIIMTRDGRALLADPSLARHVWGGDVLRTQYTPVVTQLAYRAPEVLTRSGYSQQVDVWALGCLAMLLLSGEELFGEDCVEDHAQHIEALLNTRLTGRFPSSVDDVTDDGDDRAGAARRGVIHGQRRRITRHLLRWRWRSLDTRLKAVWGTRADMRHGSATPDLLPTTADEEAVWVGFVRSCLTVDPRARPSAADAVRQLQDIVARYDSRLTATSRVSEVLVTYAAPRARAHTPPDTATTAIRSEMGAAGGSTFSHAAAIAGSAATGGDGGGGDHDPTFRSVLLHNCLSHFLRDPDAVTRLTQVRQREVENAIEVDLGATNTNGVAIVLRGGGFSGGDDGEQKRRMVRSMHRRVHDVTMLSMAARKRAVEVLDFTLPRDGCGAEETYCYAHLIALTLLDTFVATGQFHDAAVWRTRVGTQTEEHARRLTDSATWRLDVCVFACCVAAAARAGCSEFTMRAVHEAEARDVFLRIFCVLGGNTLVYTPCELASVVTSRTQGLLKTMRLALRLTETLPVHLALMLLQDSRVASGDGDAIAKKLTPRTLFTIFNGGRVGDADGDGDAADHIMSSVRDVMDLSTLKSTSMRAWICMKTPATRTFHTTQEDG